VPDVGPGSPLNRGPRHSECDKRAQRVAIRSSCLRAGEPGGHRGGATRVSAEPFPEPTRNSAWGINRKTIGVEPFGTGTGVKIVLQPELASTVQNLGFLAELEKRFPLTKGLLFYPTKVGPKERLPGVVGLLAAMTDPKLKGDTCVVLPSRERVAALTAVLVALTAARERFPELRKAYLEEGFKIGERVRVLPTMHVYEFGGLFSDSYNEFFRLRLLGDPSTSRSFPIRDAVLLEKTNSRTPKGRGNTGLGSFYPSPLDSLLDIESGGNHALLANEVLLVTTQRDFLEFMDNVSVCRAARPERSWILREVLSWGTVQPDGSLVFGERDTAAGSPLIAVSHRTEYVAEAVRRRTGLLPRVIVDGAVRIGALQALDDLVDLSKLLILADHTRLDEFDELEKRGCRVWKLPDGLVDLAGSEQGVLGEFSRAYRVASNFDLEVTSCESELCDTVAAHLTEAERVLRMTEADDEDRRALSTAYARLLDVAAIVHVPREGHVDELSRAIRQATELVESRRMFLDPAAAAHLGEALRLMMQALDVTDSDYCRDKGAKLRDLVRTLSGSRRRFAVLAPSAFAANSARNFLDREVDDEINVVTLQSFGSANDFDAIVLTGWPRRRHLQKLLNRYAAPRIHALAYDFEQAWFAHLCRHRAEALARLETHTGSLFDLTGLREMFYSVPKRLPSNPPAPVRGIDESFLDRTRKGSTTGPVSAQDAREGRLVSFIGRAYAYITQTHRLPKLTALINAPQHAQRTGIPLVTLDELDAGDYVLFRSAEDDQRDLIRTIAEQQMGTRSYTDLREYAERWKIALRKLGATSDQVWRVLRVHNFKRTHTAVHSWLSDDALIGPKHKEDIAVIAVAAGDEGLKRDLNAVWEAIRRIRGAHTSAGAHLSGLLLKYLPGQLPDIDDEEMIVDLVLGDLPLGKVLILQIDQIERRPEIRPYWEVNRVLLQT
jgi:hypothetical protein